MIASLRRLTSGRRLAVATLATLAAGLLALAPTTAVQAAPAPHGTTTNTVSTAGVPEFVGPGHGFVLSAQGRRDGIKPLSSPTDCHNMVTSNGRPLCPWVDAGYVGKMGAFYTNNAYWGSFSQSACPTGSWNDCASALYNAGSEIAVVYEDEGYSGGHGCVAAGSTGYGNLADYNWGSDGHSVNDSITSNSWTTSSSLC